MVMFTHSCRRAGLGAAFVTAGLLAGTALITPAHAALMACGSDPIVSLSNGATLDIQATIYDVGADIQHLTYTAHVPAGLTVVKVNYTKDPYAGNKETLTVYADQAVGVYTVSSLIQTKTAGIKVVATDTLTTGTSNLASATGLSGQTLSTKL
jgi:hypothetical protein